MINERSTILRAINKKKSEKFFTTNVGKKCTVESNESKTWHETSIYKVIYRRKVEKRL